MTQEYSLKRKALDAFNSLEHLATLIIGDADCCADIEEWDDKCNLIRKALNYLPEDLK
jgi:hypothetical protein